MSREHYYVKWDDNGITRYGICAYLSKAEKSKLPKGKVKVDDAILPVYYLVDEKDLIDLKSNPGTYNMKTGDWDNQGELETYVDNEFNKARKLSDSIKRGIKPGSMIGIGVADGSAWYVVTKVKGTKCDVEWRGFNPDRYFDHYFGAGRKNVPLADIKRYVDGHRRSVEIFG